MTGWEDATLDDLAERLDELTARHRHTLVELLVAAACGDDLGEIIGMIADALAHTDTESSSDE